MPEAEGNLLMWLEEEGEDDNSQQEQAPAKPVQRGVADENPDTEGREALSALEDELQRTRKELMDVRKELAAKTVQLSRKEVIVSQEKVAELAAHVATEKDKQLASLAAHVEQLELALGQKEEELEEGRRLYNAQKRALREALAAAAEAEAVERQADEVRARSAEAQVVEEELDRLQHELALLQARYNLEMRARDAEMQSLRSELMTATAGRKQAVAAAEAALSEAWQSELSRATEEAEARLGHLESELARVRQQLEDHARSSDHMALAGELASLNQQKVAIQREFDAFREMATCTAREHREAVARLMEENATLKSRLAARAFQDVQAGFKPHSKVFAALTGPPGAGLGGGVGSPVAGAGAGLGPGNAWMEHLPEALVRLERQRKGLLPALAVGGVVVLVLLVAVIRAAAVTRSEHSGGLCFLAHLGINVGPGCGPAHAHTHTHTVAEAAGEELGHLLDQAPRVHDLEGVAEQTAATVEAAEAAAEAAKAAEARAARGGEGGGEGGGGDADSRVAEAAAAEVEQTLREEKEEAADTAVKAKKGKKGKKAQTEEGQQRQQAAAAEGVAETVGLSADAEVASGVAGALVDANDEGKDEDEAEHAAEAMKDGGQGEGSDGGAVDPKTQMEAAAEAFMEAAESIMRRLTRRRLHSQEGQPQVQPQWLRRRSLEAETLGAKGAGAGAGERAELGKREGERGVVAAAAEGALRRRVMLGEGPRRGISAAAHRGGNSVDGVGQLAAGRRRSRRTLRSATSEGLLQPRGERH